MAAFIKILSSLLIALTISGSVSDMAEVTPAEAAREFFDGMASGNKQTVEAYMDNSYVNFLENVKGSDEEMKRMEKALFSGFSYKITDTAVKGDVAVAKVTIKNRDFSDVMNDYEKKSYKYVMKNLYDDKVTDKSKLNKKCLEIYVDCIEDTSKNGETLEQEIFLPMEADGYSGWRIILNDNIMKVTMGNLVLPVKAE